MAQRIHPKPARQAAHLLIASLPLLLLLFLAGCRDSPSQEKVAGAYLFWLPTGQAERWVLAPDGTFTQEFHANGSRLFAHDPNHTFTSTWSIKDDALWIEETTEYFEYRPPFALLEKPDTASWASPIPWRSSGHGSEVPIIIPSADQSVIYQKLPDEMLKPATAPGDATEQGVAGEYVGRLPSHQIETWYLDPSGHFTQQFYDNFAKYNARSPTHKFYSTWSIKDGRVWVRQTQQYCEHPYPHALLKEPDTITWDAPIPWHSSGFGIKVPFILFCQDPSVAYKRVTEEDPLFWTFGFDLMKGGP